MDRSSLSSKKMASKRKAKTPKKLGEEKRQCLKWNMNDKAGGFDQVLDCMPIQNDVHGCSSSSKCSHFTAHVNPSHLPTSKESASVSKVTETVNISSDLISEDSSSLPWLSIPLNVANAETKVGPNETVGPRLFKIVIKKYQTNESISSCMKNVDAKSIFEFWNPNSQMLLRVFDDPVATTVEKYRTDVLVMEREPDQGKLDSYRWTYNLFHKLHCMSFFDGTLVLPRTVLSNIEKSIKNRQLNLVMDPDSLNNDELHVYGCIIESKDVINAFDTSCVKKKNSKIAMESILKYFYGIYEEPTDANGKQFYRFTANEIPALYEYIKDHHSKQFNSKLTNSVALFDRDGKSCMSGDICYETSDDNPPLNMNNGICSEVVSEADFEDESSGIDEIIGDPQELSIVKRSLYDIEVKNLIPKLRKYQYSAVQWMISKENETEYELGSEDHVLWERFHGICNEGMYYNKHTGRVCSKLHVLPLPQGGILADEMGLGKTVEVLALILKNQREAKFKIQVPFDSTNGQTEFKSNTMGIEAFDTLCCFCAKEANYSMNQEVKHCFDCGVRMHFKCAGTQWKEIDKYFCPTCGTKEVIKTHCTLIISPETIVYQWIEEMQKHVKDGALQYLLYLGVGKAGYIQPLILAEYDVIITTYETLNSDFHHVKTEEGRGRKLRNRKKYIPLPSPLIYLEFWRVCLDEAQMIQCTTTKLAEMAQRINAVHRWCVTGTPLQRGLEDIYGMLLFIGVYPYCIKTWWNKLLYEPLIQGNTRPLFDVLARVMWRTEKKDVLDQINLPKQSETLKLLKFTPVEWQFYKRQEELCTANAFKEIYKWEEKETVLSSLDKSSLHSLLTPLLRLRQACCHPRAVRDGVLGIHKSHLTMDKLLEGLKMKSRVDCEEAHRQLMCAINGLAAIDIMEDNFADAVTKYREAMQSSTMHKDIIRTDLLQRLHTVKNLAFALTKATSCSHCLSDDNLESEAEELGKGYMKKSELQVEAAGEKLESVERNLDPVREAIDWKNPWWIQLLQTFRSDSMSEKERDVITKVKSELNAQLNTSKFMDNRFSTTDGLQYLLVTSITSLTDLRQKLKESLVALKEEPTREMVLKSADCCLRNVEEKASREGSHKCDFCASDDLFTDYENLLFSHRGMQKNGLMNGDDAKRYGGLRAETELDVVLKTLQSIARQNFMAEDIIAQAKSHINYMDLLKQEFKALRSLWFALHKRISALDELEMSSIRLRLRYENEDNKESYVIDKYEIPAQRLRLMEDKTVANHLLNKKKGQLFYLTNLEKAQNGLRDTNPETCPICEETLGIEWAVFSCGHCFCCQCTTRLEQQSSRHVRRGGPRIQCPMCRAPTLSEDISFVVMRNQKTPEDTEIQVKGSYSVKIEAVVRKILEVAMSDPSGKMIVFSTWQDVLAIISDALNENDIQFSYGVGCKKKFLASLTEFKTVSSIKVLLLPLKLGSKGLNIIEATHVMLVEPTLNPANEMQAVGRVHRIGQTKPTFVHRFAVRDTVEERIQDLLKTKSPNDALSNSDASSSLTIGDLTSLLL